MTTEVFKQKYCSTNNELEQLINRINIFFENDHYRFLKFDDLLQNHDINADKLLFIFKGIISKGKYLNCSVDDFIHTIVELINNGHDVDEIINNLTI